MTGSRASGTGSRTQARHRPRKDLSLESLRGLALLLMVAGHVIGQTADRGMQVADDSWWRFSYLTLADMRMPLFTFLSGYVFALRPPVRSTGYPGLMAGKARRVLLPMVTVGTLLFTMQVLVPNTNADPDPSDWWRTYVFGYEHLWFLQAIFLVFLVAGALEAAGVLTSRRGWLAAFVVTLAAMWWVNLPLDANVFSINEAAYLLPFFLLGYGISRHRPAEPVALVTALGAVCAILLALRLMAQSGTWEPAAWLSRLLGISVGLAFVLVLYGLRRALTTPVLYGLGPFSFGVYLLHPFGTAAARMALGGVGVYSAPAVFIVAMFAGLAGPVATYQVTKRLPIVHLALFGEKMHPRAPATGPS